MSYHPLLNDVILDSIFQYLEFKELKGLRVLHPVWMTIIDLLGTMKHQWYRTHLELKRCNNCVITNTTNNRILCKQKGCILSYFFKDGNLNIQFTDIVKQNSYQHTIKYDNFYFYDFMKPICEKIHIVPLDFCNDDFQHHLFCLKFHDFWIIIDFTDLTKIRHYKCDFIYNTLPVSKITDFQRVYFDFGGHGYYVDMSSVTFLKKVFELKNLTLYSGYCPQFFQNNDYSKIVHLGHHPNNNQHSRLLVYDSSGIIYDKFVKIDYLDVRKVFGICKNYILVISNLYARFYHCTYCTYCPSNFYPYDEPVMFFRIYTFPYITRVITLSDHQVFILFKWSFYDNNCNQMLGYYVNLKDKSLVEFAHHDEFVSLQYVSSVTQLNNNVFMGIGFDDKKVKFIQIILDFKMKKLWEFNQFEKLECVADDFR